MELVIILALLYFLQMFIAWRRKHGSSGGIMVLNIFLGWTGIGWLLALIWASSRA